MPVNKRKLYFYPNCRDIDFNGLVGYIGGYIGLFLGYSLLQIPDLIIFLSAMVKKCFRKSVAHVTRSLSQRTITHVDQISSNNIELGTTTRNADCVYEHTLSSLQSELEQMSQNMVEFSREIRGEVKVLKEKIEVLEGHNLRK